MNTTPVQAILGYSELLRDAPERVGHFITPIIKNANRLQKLSNDILDVTRIESGSLDSIEKRSTSMK